MKTRLEQLKCQKKERKKETCDFRILILDSKTVHENQML